MESGLPSLYLLPGLMNMYKNKLHFLSLVTVLFILHLMYIFYSRNNIKRHFFARKMLIMYSNNMLKFIRYPINNLFTLEMLVSNDIAKKFAIVATFMFRDYFSIEALSLSSKSKMSYFLLVPIKALQHINLKYFCSIN